MNIDEIQLAFRMIAQGRPQQDAAQVLILALAPLLATPEERLALTVQDEQTVEVTVTDEPEAKPAKRKGK